MLSNSERGIHSPFGCGSLSVMWRQDLYLDELAMRSNVMHAPQHQACHFRWLSNDERAS